MNKPSHTGPVMATRLNSFALGEGVAHPRERTPTTELIARAGKVEGLQALELNYPEHFVNESVEEIRDAAQAAGLAITGIQMRWPAAFARGGFTAESPQQRADAVRLACEGVDVCRAMGARHVVLWPAHDGYEYPFQLDYRRAWHQAVESYAEVARYAGDIDVSIEFKPAEPRARTLLSTTGSVLALIDEVDEANLHLTLDFAHMLMAGENAAQSVALALGRGQLRGLQLNDGYAKADDGLMVGSVHLVETLEAFFYLVRDGYTGTYYFDTDPIREDPRAECEENIIRTRHLLDLAKRLVDRGDLPNTDAVAASRDWWKVLVADHV
jgi:xylose isomerase